MSLSEDAKARIDALSREELTHEINLGPASHYQREKFAYLKTRLAELDSQETAARHSNEARDRRRDQRIAIVGIVVTAVVAIAAYFFKG
jgi:hypothetical protein